jgi:hypothetical protein
MSVLAYLQPPSARKVLLMEGGPFVITALQESVFRNLEPEAYVAWKKWLCDLLNVDDYSRMFLLQVELIGEGQVRVTRCLLGEDGKPTYDRVREEFLTTTDDYTSTTMPPMWPKAIIIKEYGDAH